MPSSSAAVAAPAVASAIAIARSERSERSERSDTWQPIMPPRSPCLWLELDASDGASRRGSSTTFLKLPATNL